jgi:hypothetical protein
VTTPAGFRLSRDGLWRSCAHGLPIVLVLSVLSMVGCRSTQELVNQQQKALVSLNSTVIAVGNAWLEGNVSTTYARTALETTGALLEKERAKIGASPDVLVDPTMTSLSESQNQLARQIAVLRKALADSDAVAVRQQITAIRSRPSQRP